MLFYFLLYFLASKGLYLVKYLSGELFMKLEIARIKIDSSLFSSVDARTHTHARARARLDLVTR